MPTVINPVPNIMRGATQVIRVMHKAIQVWPPAIRAFCDYFERPGPELGPDWTLGRIRRTGGFDECTPIMPYIIEGHLEGDEDVPAASGGSAWSDDFQRGGPCTTVLEESFEDLSAWTPLGSSSPTLIDGGLTNAAPLAVSLDNGDFIRHSIPSTSDWVTVAAHVRVSALGDHRFFYLCAEGGSPHTTHTVLSFHTDGALRVYRGDAVALLEETAPGLVTVNRWYYVELQAKLHDTEGSWTVWLDGEEVLSGTGDTKNGGTSTAYDRLVIGNSGFPGTVMIDELVLKTGSGCRTPIGPNWLHDLGPGWVDHSGVLVIENGAAIGVAPDAPGVPYSYVSNTMFWHEPQGDGQVIEVEVENMSPAGYSTLFTRASLTDSSSVFTDYGFGGGDFHLATYRFYADPFPGDWTNTFDGGFLTMPAPAQPFTIRMESDADGVTHRVYVNDALAYECIDNEPGPPATGSYVGFGVEWQFHGETSSPRVLRASGGTPPIEIHRVNDVMTTGSYVGDQFIEIVTDNVHQGTGGGDGCDEFERSTIGPDWEQVPYPGEDNHSTWLIDGHAISETNANFNTPTPGYYAGDSLIRVGDFPGAQWCEIEFDNFWPPLDEHDFALGHTNYYAIVGINLHLELPGHDYDTFDVRAQYSSIDTWQYRCTMSSDCGITYDPTVFAIDVPAAECDETTVLRLRFESDGANLLRGYFNGELVLEQHTEGYEGGPPNGQCQGTRIGLRAMWGGEAHAGNPNPVPTVGPRILRACLPSGSGSIIPETGDQFQIVEGAFVLYCQANDVNLCCTAVWCEYRITAAGGVLYAYVFQQDALGQVDVSPPKLGSLAQAYLEGFAFPDDPACKLRFEVAQDGRVRLLASDDEFTDVVAIDARVPALTGDRMGFAFMWHRTGIGGGGCVDDFERADGAIGPNWEIYDPWDTGQTMHLPTISDGAAVTVLGNPGGTTVTDMGAARWHEDINGLQSIEIEVSAYGQSPGDWYYQSVLTIHMQGNATDRSAYEIVFIPQNPEVPFPANGPNGALQWSWYALDSTGSAEWFPDDLYPFDTPGYGGYYQFLQPWTSSASYTVRVEAEPGHMRLWIDGTFIWETTIHTISGPKVGFVFDWRQYGGFVGQPLRIERACIGGVGGGTSVDWTDTFTDLTAWHLDPNMNLSETVPIFFEVADGAVTGRSAYACWGDGCPDLGIPSGRTVISSMTRNEPAGGNQYIEVVCHDFWQRHVSLSLANPDCNLRIRVYLYTHYDPVTPSPGHRTLFAIDNWSGGITSPLKYNFTIVDPTGDLTYPSGASQPSDWDAQFASGDMTFRVESDDTGHVVVLLDGEVMADVMTTPRLGDYQGVQLWWDLQMGTNPAYVPPSFLSASGGGTTPAVPGTGEGSSFHILEACGGIAAIPPFVRTELFITVLVDTTGSMWLPSDMYTGYDALVDELGERFDFQMAVIDFADFVDERGDGPFPGVILQGFTPDPVAMKAAFRGLNEDGGGGDTPETGWYALMLAFNELAWQGSKRIALIITDAGPLDPEPYTGTTLADVVAVAQSLGVSVFTLNPYNYLEGLELYGDLGSQTLGGLTYIDWGPYAYSDLPAEGWALLVLQFLELITPVGPPLPSGLSGPALLSTASRSAVRSTGPRSNDRGGDTPVQPDSMT